MTWFGIFLDLVLIGLLGMALSYAIKLTRQLNDMRAHRADMERFVTSFTASVMRAEAGIQALKMAARSSGDDLEQLIDKGQSLREELMFLTESADQIAARLSLTATQVAKAKMEPMATAPTKPPAQPQRTATVSSLATETRKAPTKTASAAERELARALEKMG